MIGNKHTAQRIVNAEASFIATVREIAGCSQEEAEKVLRVYRRLKVAKLDAVNGRINVAHGVYLEADVIRNAIGLDEAGLR